MLSRKKKKPSPALVAPTTREEIVEARRRLEIVNAKLDIIKRRGQGKWKPV